MKDSESMLLILFLALQDPRAGQHLDAFPVFIVFISAHKFVQRPQTPANAQK